MVNWFVIIILLIIVIFVVKLSHLRHRVFIIFLVILALFLYSSMALLGNKNDLDFKSAEGIVRATKVYLGWLANGFQNMKTITGNAIGMNWSSINGTFFNKTTEKTNKTIEKTD